jgi:hypothetical protein
MRDFDRKTVAAKLVFTKYTPLAIITAATDRCAAPVAALVTGARRAQATAALRQRAKALGPCTQGGNLYKAASFPLIHEPAMPLVDGLRTRVSPVL